VTIGWFAAQWKWGDKNQHSIVCSKHVHLAQVSTAGYIHIYIYIYIHIYIHTYIYIYTYIYTYLGCEMICQRTWMAVPSFSSHDARDRWFKFGSVRLFLRSVRDDLIYIYFSIFGRTHQADTWKSLEYIYIHIYIFIETWYNQDPIFGIMPCLLVCFCPSLC
jgi:hypothetical protein